MGDPHQRSILDIASKCRISQPHSFPQDVLAKSRLEAPLGGEILNLLRDPNVPPCRDLVTSPTTASPELQRRSPSVARPDFHGRRRVPRGSGLPIPASP